MHLNKRSSEANGLYRLTASGDFAAAARSVLVVGLNMKTQSGGYWPLGNSGYACVRQQRHGPWRLEGLLSGTPFQVRGR